MSMNADKIGVIFAVEEPSYSSHNYYDSAFVAHDLFGVSNSTLKPMHLLANN